MGHRRRPGSRPPADAVGEHVQAAELLGDARGVPRAAVRGRARGRRRVRLEGRRRAAAHAGVQRPRGDPRGRRRVRSRRAHRRARVAGDPGGGVLGDPGRARGGDDGGGGTRSRARTREAPRASGRRAMDWVDELQRLREARTPAVIVTLAMVRGHAPRNGGAKLVVSPDGLFGTVGGGNLEATAVDQAREMLADGAGRAPAAHPHAQRQGHDRIRRPMLRRRSHHAARTGPGGAVRRDLRPRPCRAGARPHPRPAGDGAAPHRRAPRDARSRPRGRAGLDRRPRRRGRHGATAPRSRFPRPRSPTCPPARTC